MNKECSNINEDLRLLDGGLGNEREIPAHVDNPTWLVDEAWRVTMEVCHNALDAYMDFCKKENYPHSYLLGLDILFMGVVDHAHHRKLVDIRPTIVEGPCCNSYPACPNIDSYRLYHRASEQGLNPDMVDYPTHPTKILAKMTRFFELLWNSKGNSGLPRVGIFTRPYPESEEETAHNLVLNALKRSGFEAYRITPEEKPIVMDGKISVHGVPIDICYRRIERIHVPQFYGSDIGTKIIENSPNTIWVNPWKVDDLRSKTLEEKVFRSWEEKTGVKISRPRTLLNDEINPFSVDQLSNNSGYVMKKWNSTGGKGVFLHVNLGVAEQACRFLYKYFNGRHMILFKPHEFKNSLTQFEKFEEDTAIQQLRLVDARDDKANKLVYDTRINVLYHPVKKKWEFLSGISRAVPCGEKVDNGNSLLTNISSGAEEAPLIIGIVKNREDREKMHFGPLMQIILDGKSSMEF